MIKRWKKADDSCFPTSYGQIIFIVALYLWGGSHAIASQGGSSVAVIPNSLPLNSAALYLDTQITKGQLIVLAQTASLLPRSKSKINREVLAEYAVEALAKKHLNNLQNKDSGLIRVERKIKHLTRVFLGPFQNRLEAQPILDDLKQRRVLFKFSFDNELQAYVIRLGAFEKDQDVERFSLQLEKLKIGGVKKTPVMLNFYQVVRITIPQETPKIVDVPKVSPPPPPLVVEPPKVKAVEAPKAKPVEPSDVVVISVPQFVEPSMEIEGLGIEGLFIDDGPRDNQEKSEPSIWADFEWSGFYRNETAYRYQEPRSISKARSTLYLDVRYPVTDNIELFAAGWAYYDVAYDLFNDRTIAARVERNDEEPLVFIERLDREKDSNVKEIRELYADFSFDGLDLRVGKQFIVWGVLEGVRVVDEINPIDFRELINLDLLDYRIPLWSLKLDYFREDTSYQLVWIPDLRFNKPAPRGSEWELLQDVCVGQAEEILCIDSSPESWTLKDSEIGLKIDTYLWDTELSFSYFYTWDDFPVIFRSIRVNDNTVPPAFYPLYTRIHMFGATAVKQLGNYILKGELAYVTGKYFGTKNVPDRDANGYLDDDGELIRNHFRWGLGTEFNIMGMDVSPGIAQWVIMDYDESIMQERLDTSFFLFLRKELPEKAAVFQMLAIYLVSLKELLLKPEITFQFSDNLQLGIGLDLFYGLKSDFGSNQSQVTSAVFDPNAARAQFIGNFNNNDRIYFDFKYSF